MGMEGEAGLGLWQMGVEVPSRHSSYEAVLCPVKKLEKPSFNQTVLWGHKQHWHIEREEES